MEEFVLPDPLPDRLPGESHNAYRTRVVPGFCEWKRLHKPWRRFAGQAVRTYQRDNGVTGTLPADVATAVLDVAWDVFSQQRPEDAARLSDLGQRMPWVSFDD